MSLPLSPTMVERFFEIEKLKARQIWRDEMDSCMDTIFGQMKRKLMQLVESGGDETELELGELGDPMDSGQELYESSNVLNPIPSISTNSNSNLSVLNISNLTKQNVLDDTQNHGQQKLFSSTNQRQSGGNGDFVLIENPTGHDQLSNVHFAQPSTSSHLIPPHQNVHYFYQQPNGNPIHCNDNSNQQSEMIQPIIPSNSQVNNDELSNESSGQHHSSFLPATIVNEQSNNSPNNLNVAYEDAEICECEDCLNGIEIVEEIDDDDDDSDSVQWIDDVEDEQELPRPTKRPRMDSTLLNNATQPEIMSPREPTDQAQANQVTKQFITVHLQCPLSECPDTFPEDQLTQHMFDVHSIRSNRCLVKDCKQSFDNHIFLSQHLKQAHPHSTQWHCDKCSKYFSKYKRLSNHTTQLHQLGHFQCSFPSCTFTGECRVKVFEHYKKQHKVDFVCTQTGCNYRTYNVTRLKAHERVHLGIRPYRCKWPDCPFSSSYLDTTLAHIRAQHLPRLDSTNQTDGAHSADPKDYLEVASELL